MELINGVKEIRAEQLITEIDNLKEWDNAPENATEKTVTWTRNNFRERLGGETHIRELPKSPERERAEKLMRSIFPDMERMDNICFESAVKKAESAFNEYKESVK